MKVKPFEDLHQSFVLGGLGEMGVESGLFAALPVQLLAPSGKRDQEDMLAPWLFADHARSFEAVELRHGDVEHSDVRAKFGCGFHGFDPVMRHLHIVAVLPE